MIGGTSAAALLVRSLALGCAFAFREVGHAPFLLLDSLLNYLTSKFYTISWIKSSDFHKFVENISHSVEFILIYVDFFHV